jgi:hypothetical protein
MVHPDLFDDVRMPVLRATDRLRALAPVIDEALRGCYGPNWGERLRQQDRQARRSTSGLYDPRYLLRLIAHEPALFEIFDAGARRQARSLSAMANFVAHRDYRRLRPMDRLMAGVHADALLRAAGLEVAEPLPERPPEPEPEPRPPERPPGPAPRPAEPERPAPAPPAQEVSQRSRGRRPQLIAVVLALADWGG